MMIENGCFQKRNEHSLPFIAVTVVLVHLMLLFILNTYQNSQVLVKKPAKLLVQTVKLMEKEKVIADTKVKEEAEVVQTHEPKVVVEKKELKSKKTVEEPKIEKTVISAKKIKEPQNGVKDGSPGKDSPGRGNASLGKDEAVKAKHKELLAQAKRNLANVKHTSFQKRDDAELKKNFEINALSVDTTESSSENSLNVRERGYRDELASRLKALLILPERGDVQVKLTLLRSGHVKHLVVVNAESEKNRKYIETAINALSFPSFQDNFNNFAEYTFLITLK